MTEPKIGILSPGDMGHTVGRVLISNGLEVFTCLVGRSQRTRRLSDIAGILDLPSYQDLVEKVDILLSILVPAEAKNAAGRTAQALVVTGAELAYVDCNAVAPGTACEIGEIITTAGGCFVDASIIGPPPRKPDLTRFYASGPSAAQFEVLNQYGLKVILIGDEVGQASAIKMCYASLTKGLTALCTELLTAAEALNVSDALKKEFQQSQPVLFERMERGLPRMPPKSRRFVGEMEEIAKTFGSVGLTAKILEGAADMYRFVGGTPLADRAPEDVDLPDLGDLIISLTRHLP
jgi:3-hydroxyisobutyrate dehydrogenase-like beta-hydroxyacid dehydrogenase